MCFPIAAKMTLQSAGSNGNSLPCRWFSGHGLPPISFVTSPGSAAQRRSHRRVQSLTADYVLHDVSAGQNKNPRTAAAIIAHRQSWQFCDGSREYLTAAEVEKLIKTARDGRYGHRDATLILIAFRHALRATEICDLEWSQVEFGRSASLHVRRLKNGKPSVHPSAVTSSGHCGSCDGSFPIAVTSLPPSAAAYSLRTPSIGLLSADMRAFSVAHVVENTSACGKAVAEALACTRVGDYVHPGLSAVEHIGEDESPGSR
jgi:hypothetical protein